ncbi:hypothetical protein PRZ48_011367 [Zasmidium cellare]|uniref:Uncharacterized protein n=1 Tax=Zasmidium cellare TaxID=395010 RepID=A0ABR0E750_ZASCE|nr:hypothetical protein PRZ48_011367 [Zasmidium cellare]
MPPPNIDFGALFGLGGFTADRKVDDWKYQPPGVKERPKPSRWDLGIRQMAKKDRWEAFLEVPEESPEDRIQKSKQAFEELLLKKSATEQLGAEDLKEVRDFLQSTENEPGACNTLRLTEGLILHKSLEANFSLFSELLLGKVKLQTLGDGELTSILLLLVGEVNAAEHVQDMARLLDSIPNEAVLAHACTTLTRMLQPDNTSQAPSPRLRIWLRIVRGVQKLQGDRPQAAPWRGTYEILARRFPYFTSLNDHFSTMKSMELCRVLLRYWIPVISLSGEDEARDMTVTGGHHKKYLAQPQEHRPHINKLIEDFESLSSRYMTRSEKKSGFGSVAQLIAVLHRHRLPYVGFCNGIFDILMQSASTGAVYRVFYGITHHAEIGIDNNLAQKLIHFFLNKQRLSLAEKVFADVTSLPLSACYELPIAIARDRACSAPRLWTVLQRLTLEDDIPPGQRHHPRNALPSEHVDLIHLVAFYISQSQHLNPRSAFRRIWECYLFLRDRLAPIKPMLTQAMVTAAVNRPLKSLQKVSRVQFRYILMLVARVEGQRVAEKLDRLAGGIWDNHVLPNIRARNAAEALHQLSGPLTETKAEASATKTKLLAARFRSGRRWLKPDKMRERFDPTDYEPFPGLLDPGQGDEPGPRELVVGESSGYSPFELAESTASHTDISDKALEGPSSTEEALNLSMMPEAKEAVEETVVLELSQQLDILRDLPLAGNSVTAPSANLIRSGLGYVSVHTPVDGKADHTAPSSTRSAINELADLSIITTAFSPLTSADPLKPDLPAQDFTDSVLGASLDESPQTSNRSPSLHTVNHTFDLAEATSVTLVHEEDNREVESALALPPHDEVTPRDHWSSERAASDEGWYWKPLKVTPSIMWRLNFHDTSPIWKSVALDTVVTQARPEREHLSTEASSTASPQTSGLGRVAYHSRAHQAVPKKVGVRIEPLDIPSPADSNSTADVKRTSGTHDADTAKPSDGMHKDARPTSFDHGPSPSIQSQALVRLVERVCRRKSTKPNPNKTPPHTPDGISWRMENGRFNFYVVVSDQWTKIRLPRAETVAKKFERGGQLERAETMRRMVRGAVEEMERARAGGLGIRKVMLQRQRRNEQ